MPKGLVYALHGFLGKGSDWSLIQQALQKSGVQFVSDSLFAKESEDILDFKNYAKRIIQKVRALHEGDPKVFVGYSLGGRIGLSILAEDPQLFDHYIFLSTNPGLSNEAVRDRLQRIQSDQQWSEQITEANWNHFIKNWNEQPIFAGSNAEPTRHIDDYDLDKLKKSLSIWSLGNQKDLTDVIKLNQNKITWIVGDSDHKFLEIAESLKQKKILLDYKRISSSHRIWCDQPIQVVELLRNLF